jgi:hypothetical protein
MASIIDCQRNTGGRRAPILSLVLCSRSDQYMGNSIWRIATALNYAAQNIHELDRADDVEILVADWGSQTPLREILELSEAAAGIVSFILIPPELAQDLQRDSPFPEVLALNAAVRRARGMYIGRIDQDTLVGKHFLNTFFEMYESPRLPVPLDGALLLSNRRRIPYRLANRCPPSWAIERFIDRFGESLPLMNPLPPHLFYQSYVGMWLLHRDLWIECGGYDESFLYMDWQEVDMILRLTPKYTLINLGELTDHDLYHLDHGNPRQPWGSDRKRKTNPVRSREQPPPRQHPNGPDWGLNEYPLQAMSALRPTHASNPSTSSLRYSQRFTFALLLLTTRTQIEWDRIVTFSRQAVIRPLRFLLSLSPVWTRRVRMARESVREQPLRNWPRSLARIRTGERSIKNS